MKYTQRQWDREVGWGKVPKEYAHETKLEEYKRKINYDVWEDVINVKGEEMSNPQFDSLWNPWNTSYKNVTVNVTYTMKEKDYVYHTDIGMDGLESWDTNKSDEFKSHWSKVTDRFPTHIKNDDSFEKRY